MSRTGWKCVTLFAMVLALIVGHVDGKPASVCFRKEVGCCWKYARCGVSVNKGVSKSGLEKVNECKTECDKVCYYGYCTRKCEKKCKVVTRSVTEVGELHSARYCAKLECGVGRTVGKSGKPGDFVVPEGKLVNKTSLTVGIKLDTNAP